MGWFKVFYSFILSFHNVLCAWLNYFVFYYHVVLNQVVRTNGVIGPLPTVVPIRSFGIQNMTLCTLCTMEMGHVGLIFHHSILLHIIVKIQLLIRDKGCVSRFVCPKSKTLNFIFTIMLFVLHVSKGRVSFVWIQKNRAGSLYPRFSFSRNYFIPFCEISLFTLNNDLTMVVLLSILVKCLYYGGLFGPVVDLSKISGGHMPTWWICSMFM